MPVDTHVSFVPQENDSGTLDTVGAVVVDHEGNVAVILYCAITLLNFI